MQGAREILQVAAQAPDRRAAFTRSGKWLEQLPEEIVLEDGDSERVPRLQQQVRMSVAEAASAAQTQPDLYVVDVLIQ